ncbi:hypothetical protein [Rhizobium rhizogenes]|uniref:hypothetical protein n=1 Tax=Rhizobium rhizogenes TaxID=359 RepID=UPI002868A464|nr:hypothetical protein [Rhizobium rhizogenes]
MKHGYFLCRLDTFDAQAGHEWNERNGCDMIEAARFVFRGQMVCDSFVEFARHRARRLDLHIEFGACDARSATLAVKGQNDLVDAFEMACSLGPYDCVVLDIERSSL